MLYLHHIQKLRGFSEIFHLMNIQFAKKTNLDNLKITNDYIYKREGLKRIKYDESA